MTTPSGPLKGLRVLDLTRVLAGPTCTQMLGDLGAEVIKIERPEAGDDTRGFAPPFWPETKESAYFLGVNRNKLSVTVDIAKPEGQALIHKLLEHCDILAENFKVGALAKYGLGWEQLKEKYPRLIYCSITGFGQTGPYAPRPGYDALIQAMGGVMSLTGEPNGSPQKVGVPVADLFAGLYGCIGILAALNHRNATGEGQQIDIGMLDTHVAWLANQGMNYIATGENPPRLGNQHPNISPYQEFPTKDGYMILAVGNDPTFERFCKAFGQEALLADPRFATNPQRVANRDLVTQTLTPLTKSKTTTEWVEALEALKIACGPINTLEQVFADPHVQARGMRVKMPHASGQEIEVIANPVKLSATPPDYRVPPPVLGQHTDSVLRDLLGMSEAEVAALKEKGIL
ncbi:CaiB/BaiF CoA transferase family protein [Roseococcus suduntuyensis]|uniref:Crotonobetainyl-CoA:carnitine CoA-transferase CaiB-like acyl-CoA transferase n=1 Tax=Roseococcus suduntuyensis TaxID=455361 RepID=A0A840AF10_9PROT|nr:CaiB/BaiF CoA-transferase family protein [Roseococcus suduntuyensis]MBB3899647.1 crotonobetainyl-CoA:carnitine CoA-transferase CaiB-like acyl-CoA transferase [Roseococcus suduntuyensis]